MKRLMFVAAAVGAAVSASAADFGQKVEALQKAQVFSLYGVPGTLNASSTLNRTVAELNADAASAITLAPGLTATVVSAADPAQPVGPGNPAGSAKLAANIDQMVFWPEGSPTHIIACNEQGASDVAVQRIRLADGFVETIVSSGIGTCDPVRKTPWGTILIGEETGATGRLFEILDPLVTTAVTITAGVASDPTHVVWRQNVGTLSWEGIAILPTGVMYMTDENRPDQGSPGGAFFKFIPATPWVPGSPAITNLAASPFAGSGALYGFRAGKRTNAAVQNADYGQANEFGRGSWVSLGGAAPLNLRTAAVAAKLTSYYRPEDTEFDPVQLAAGNVRFCGTNTGEDTQPGATQGDNHWGEIYCFRDGTVAQATANTAIPEYQPLLIGNFEFAMPDNVAYRFPDRGYFVINEDGEGPFYSTPRNNDIWACLDDGADVDQLSDGCVRLMSINDLTAETTGGVFNAAGSEYYVSVQHNKTGHGIVLKITGWQ